VRGDERSATIRSLASVVATEVRIADLIRHCRASDAFGASCGDRPGGPRPRRICRLFRLARTNLQLRRELADGEERASRISVYG